MPGGEAGWVERTRLGGWGRGAHFNPSESALAEPEEAGPEHCCGVTVGGARMHREGGGSWGE